MMNVFYEVTRNHALELLHYVPHVKNVTVPTDHMPHGTCRQRGIHRRDTVQPQEVLSRNHIDSSLDPAKAYQSCVFSQYQQMKV